MLKIAKNKTEMGYSFIVTTKQGMFEIIFAGNLDLYWKYIYQGSILEEPNYKEFVITKENYYLYSLIEELYNNIKNCNVYQLDKNNIMSCTNFEGINKKSEKIIELNSSLKDAQQYNPERIFCNNTVEWHSDDAEYSDSSVLKIENLEDNFVITFERGKPDGMFYTYSVSISNSGSRYNPFNILFMNMYHKLINYEPDYHQVHIEEYLYQKKLEKNRINI